MSSLHSIHFTLEDANSTLQEIKPLLSEMIELKENLDEKGYDILHHQYFGGIGPNGTGAFPSDMERLVEVVKIISKRGVIIKNMNRSTRLGELNQSKSYYAGTAKIKDVLK